MDRGSGHGTRVTGVAGPRPGERRGRGPVPLEILQEDEASLRWRLVGDLDLATADVLVETVVPRIEEPDAAVALDLRELSFVDSSGIRALISIATRLAGGTLTLVAPSPPVAKVLQLVRADSFPNLRIEADG